MQELIYSPVSQSQPKAHAKAEAILSREMMKPSAGATTASGLTLGLGTKLG